MRKYSFLRRLFIFLAGTCLAGIGVAATARAELGTSPISSVPYVLTFLVPLTFGMATFLVNVVLLALQYALLRSNFRKHHWGQLAVALAFGLFVDLGMLLTAFYIPQSYGMKLLELLLGCATLAFGVALQLTADVLYLPGDGFVKVFAEQIRKRFEFTKIGFDFSLAAMAVLISVIAMGSLVGVREGTLLSVICIGMMIRFFLSRNRVIRKWMIVPASSL